MRLLLDTCVLSELQKPHVHPSVRRILNEIASENLYVSVISIAEIAKGIALLNPGKRKHALQRWIQTLERYHQERLLPIDLETTRIWGELTATAQKAGKAIPVSNGLIAATAHRHGLHLVTRDTSHFDPTGVMLIDPWADIY